MIHFADTVEAINDNWWHSFLVGQGDEALNSTLCCFITSIPINLPGILTNVQDWPGALLPWGHALLPDAWAAEAKKLGLKTPVKQEQATSPVANGPSLEKEHPPPPESPPDLTKLEQQMREKDHASSANLQRQIMEEAMQAQQAQVQPQPDDQQMMQAQMQGATALVQHNDIGSSMVTQASMSFGRGNQAMAQHYANNIFKTLMPDATADEAAWKRYERDMKSPMTLTVDGARLFGMTNRVRQQSQGMFSGAQVQSPFQSVPEQSPF